MITTAASKMKSGCIRLYETIYGNYTVSTEEKEEFNVLMIALYDLTITAVQVSHNKNLIKAH